ncbi:MAG: 50S ribosomal protein L21 [Myxococcota bacterium]
MYAVIATGGKQYRVRQGDVIRVELLHSEPGREISFEPLLVGGGDDGARVGNPTVEGATVKATVRRDGKHAKLWSFKKWDGPWAKIRGHRQKFTELEITAIEG